LEIEFDAGSAIIGSLGTVARQLSKFLSQEERSTAWKQVASIKGSPLSRLWSGLSTPDFRPGFAHLGLDAQRLDDSDAKFFTTIELPKLKCLSLTDDKIGELGVAVLIEHFRNLRFVDLEGNPGDPHFSW
jgi:hypothetical protein